MLESNEDFIQRSIEQLEYELQESGERQEELYTKKEVYEEIVEVIEKMEINKEDKRKFSKMLVRKEVIEKFRKEIEIMEHKIGYYSGVKDFIHHLLNDEEFKAMR